MSRPADYAEGSAIRIFVMKCLGRVPGGGFIKSTIFPRTYLALTRSRKFSKNIAANFWRNSEDNVSDDTLDLTPDEASEPAPKHIPYHALDHIPDHTPGSPYEHTLESLHIPESSKIQQSSHTLECPHAPELPHTPEYTPPSSPSASLHTTDYETYRGTPESPHTPEHTPPSSPSASLHTTDYKTYRSLPKPRFPIRMSDAKPQPPSLESTQRWVRWESCFLGGDGDPKWRIEPEIQLIKLVVGPVLKLLGMDESMIEVAYLSQGGFNKVYTITTCDRASGCLQSYVFRIPLPVYPYYKIESEVATTEYIRNFTGIPVPKIYAYDSTLDNPLGLEWMLMEKAVGNQLGDRWLDMSNESHISLVQQIAVWQNELVNNTTNEMGGLYMRWTYSDLEFFIGPCVHHVFWLENRYLYKANRGPFKSIRDFVAAALLIQYQETEDPSHQPPHWVEKVKGQSRKTYCAEIKKEFPDITDEEADSYCHRIYWGIANLDLDDVRFRINALRVALPRICDPDEEEEFQTSLSHYDLSGRNILVDDDGKVTSVLDWEHTEFLPLEHFQLYPKFLQGSDREDSGNLMWERLKDEPDWWDSFEEKSCEIVQTRLRPVYKDQLVEMDSPLLLCEDVDSFWVELLDKCLGVMWVNCDYERWIKRQWDYEREREKETLALKLDEDYKREKEALALKLDEGDPMEM